MSTPPNPKPLRILMLHGFTQSPTLFRAKTGALHKALAKAFPSSSYRLQLIYVSAPHRLPVADMPNHDPAALDVAYEDAPEAWGWWRRKDRPSIPGGIVYEGIEKGLESVAQCIRKEGPFEGVVGFSQGAAAAAMVAALLDGRTRREAFEKGENEHGISYPASFLAKDGEEGVDGFLQGPLKFAVCYSGFRAPSPLYRSFYEPRIRTPVLNVLGQMDVVVDEARAKELVAACENGEARVVVHPGGHFVPSQKPWLDAIVGFVKECLEGKVTKDKEEVSAEDMEVPF